VKGQADLARPNCHIGEQTIKKFIHSDFVGSAHPFSDHEESYQERDCQQRYQKQQNGHGNILRTRLACLTKQKQSEDAKRSRYERH
jgi:hypothetical protein